MADPAAHVDVEVLADLDAGLLEPGQAAPVRAHVEACSQCATVLADLRRLPSLLAADPLPATPPDVAARLEAAIQRAAADRTADDRAGADDSRSRQAGADTGATTVVSLSRRRRWVGPTLAAAVTAGLLAIAVPIVTQNGGDSADSAATSEESGDAHRSDSGGAAVAGPESDPPTGPGAEDDGPRRVAALSGATFGDDVVETFYVGREVTVVQSVDPGSGEENQFGALALPTDADACSTPLASSRSYLVTVDGRTARLYLTPRGELVEAIAVACGRRTTEGVLAAATLRVE